ncbi:MAG: 30S ribosomal protein S5 [Patescibacteria group bacterium]|jgi:small subunit ribosomal protein S5
MSMPQNTSKRFPKREEREKDEFDQKVIEITRVTRVQAGGKRMRFRACVVVGDRKGKVGMGVSKGADVATAVNKAITLAKKDLFTVKIVKDSIPHVVLEKNCGAQVLLKPATQGRGIIAGGPVRAVLELSGIKNVVSKMLASKNKISNVRATIQALKKMRTKEEIEQLKKS